MNPPEQLRIELKRGGDDPQVHEPAYQVELRKFTNLLDANEIRYSQSGMTFDSVGARGFALGVFTLSVITDHWPTISAALVAWIAGKYGRKVRVKFGDIEVEAASKKEVEQLFEKLLKMAHRKRQSKQEPNK